MAPQRYMQHSQNAQNAVPQGEADHVITIAFFLAAACTAPYTPLPWSLPPSQMHFQADENLTRPGHNRWDHKYGSVN